MASIILVATSNPIEYDSCSNLTTELKYVIWWVQIFQYIWIGGTKNGVHFLQDRTR